MKLLLDTHVFIWWDQEPARLPARVESLCTDPENTLLLSIASVWEMQIKLMLDKLRLRGPLSQVIEQQRDNNDLQILPIELRHVWALANLPHHHGDPFDRLLIAQSLVEDLTLVTADQRLRAYPLTTLWD